MGAALNQPARSLHAPHPTAYSRDDAACDGFHHMVVLAASYRGIQVDHLNLSEAREHLQHLIGGASLKRLVPPLHKLHNLAFLNINARNDHVQVTLGRTGTCAASSAAFRSPTVYLP